MAQLLGAHTVLSMELRWLPAATFGDSQLSVTPAPGRSLPLSSSGTCTPMHISP